MRFLSDRARTLPGLSLRRPEDRIRSRIAQACNPGSAATGDKLQTERFVPEPYRPGSFLLGDAKIPERFVCKPRYDVEPKALFVEQVPHECSDMLVQPRLFNAPYAEQVWPYSLNTIRVLTLVDDDGPYVAGWCHYWGHSQSGPIDRWWGGIASSISGAGVLGRSVHSQHRNRLDDHPDSDVRINGLVIPLWWNVLDAARKSARNIAEAGVTWCCWDIASTTEGVRVLEGNSAGYVDAVELCHGPLGDDPRVVAFLHRAGVRLPW